MLSELYGSKYDKILIISHPLRFYRLMSKSTRKTSITLYVFLHGFYKQGKESDMCNFIIFFTFYFLSACRDVAMCRAAVNHLFPLLRNAEIGSMTAKRIHTAQGSYGRKGAYVTRCIIISGAYGTFSGVEPA